MACRMRRSLHPSRASFAARRVMPALWLGLATGFALACSSSDDDDEQPVPPSAGAGGQQAAAGAAGVGGDTAAAGTGGAAGAGGGGPLAVACPEAALFCDDFEQAALGA